MAAWVVGAWYVGAWAGTVWEDAAIPIVVDHGAGHKKKKRQLPHSDQPYVTVPYPYPDAPEEIVEEILIIDPPVSGVLIPRIALADVIPVIEALKVAPIQSVTLIYSDEAYRKRQRQLKDEDDLIIAFIKLHS